MVEIKWKTPSRAPHVLGPKRPREHSRTFHFGPKKGQSKDPFKHLEEKWAEDHPQKPRKVRKKLSRLEARTLREVRDDKAKLGQTLKASKCPHDFTYKFNTKKIECEDCGISGLRTEIEEVLGPVKPRKAKHFDQMGAEVKKLPAKWVADEPQTTVKRYKSWEDMRKDNWHVDNLMRGGVAKVKKNEKQLAHKGKPTRNPLRSSTKRGRRAEQKRQRN